MASSFCATASSLPFPSPVRPKKYDVFISFSGEDTRSTFTCHLDPALRRRNIETYVDDRLDRGDVISDALMKAIKDSCASLIIFSENYAFSKWCLDELTKIMECKKLEGQIVIPVFYKIDPSHVRQQSGSYMKAFEKHERDMVDKDKVLKWKVALTEAANLAGHHSKIYRTDYELIEDVVKAVLKKLKLMDPSELREFVGVEQNCVEIESLLGKHSSDVRIIGIWGIGGIGKTTLAAILFSKLAFQYEGRCFLGNVRRQSEQYGLSYLRCMLLSKLLGEENTHISTPQAASSTMSTPQVASSTVSSRLKSKKVFIVLDDISTSEQLKYLIGERDWLGMGSRVIVTTRDNHVISEGVDEIYKVKELNFEDSLRLFCLNAFNKINPEMQYEVQKQYAHLSVTAALRVEGNPLALKVLSAFLRYKSKTQWSNVLRKLQENNKIQDVLRLSYDDLSFWDQELFLGIACFLKGRDMNNVIKLLGCWGFYPKNGIRYLVDRALITISNYNTVEMHDLIEEMGRDIARQESRLGKGEKFYHILKDNIGTDAVEGAYLASDASNQLIKVIVLKVPRDSGREENSVHLPSGLETLPNNSSYLHWSGYPLKSLPSTFCAEKHILKDNIGTDGFEGLYLASDAINQLIEVKVLEVHRYGCREESSVCLPSGLETLPNNLSYLHWSRYPLMSLPSTFFAENLVELSMPDSRLQKLWDAIPNLPNLGALKLYSSIQLLEVLELSTISNLKSMYLIGCTSLRFGHLSILSLAKLKRLHLNRRNTLESLRRDTSSNFSKYLPAIGSSSPLNFNRMPNQKRRLYFGSTGELPPSTSPLDMLDYFTFRVTENFDKLDLMLEGYWYIKELDLSGCPLYELPENINKLIFLRYLELNGSRLVKLPANINHLSGLRFLGIRNCCLLNSLPELPPLIQLDARDCTSLETLFCSIREHPLVLCKSAAFYLFENCIGLGQPALDPIMEDAHVRIKLAAYNLLEEEGSLADEEDADDGKISICIPGNKCPNWFSYCSEQPSFTVELPAPSEILGFAFCVILPASESDNKYNIGCECSFEADDAKTVNLESWFLNDHLMFVGESKLDSDHIYLWYDACGSAFRMDEFMYSSVNIKKFSCRFFTVLRYNKGMEMSTCEVSNEKRFDMKEVTIRSCGVQPIYAPIDPITIEDGKEFHNLEPLLKRRLSDPSCSYIQMLEEE